MAMIDNSLSLEYRDIKLIPKKSILNSREEASVSSYLGKHKFRVPVCAANMKSIITPQICKIFDSRGWRYTYHRIDGVNDVLNFVKFANDELNLVSISIGVGKDWIKLLSDICLYNFNVDYILIDVAHCWNDNIVDTVDTVKRLFPDAYLIVGNTSSPECVEWLESLGVDCVRIGQGVSCFAGGTRILMSNGTYKDIEKLNVGDRVISGTGNPTTVTGVRLSGYKSAMSYYHPRFYKPTICTNEHLHFVSDLDHLSFSTISSVNRAKFIENREWSYRWKSAGNLSKLDSFLLPLNINFEGVKSDFSLFLDDFCESDRTISYNKSAIKPSYELGYLIGAFVGDGTAGTYTIPRVSPRNSEKLTTNTNHNCNFTFDKDEYDIASKVVECVKKVFNVEAKLVLPNSKGHQNNTHVVYIHCNPVSKFFQKFYNLSSEKFIPTEYFVNDKEYLSGILDGFYDSDGSEKGNGRVYINTSKELLEQAMVACYLVNGFFPSISQPKKYSESLLKNGRTIKPTKDSYRLYYSDKYVTNHRNKDFFVFEALDFDFSYTNNLQIPVYDIEVECETSSFVANNVIVHNSSCRTAQYTGFGSTSVGTLIECSAAAKNIKIMSDGGLTTEGTDVWIGDIAKAIRFGADWITSGALFSKCIDSPALLTGYAGNSTAEMKGYRKNVEGAVVKVETNGLTIEQMMELVEDSLRSSVSYSGGKTLDALRTVDFIDMRGKCGRSN